MQPKAQAFTTPVPAKEADKKRKAWEGDPKTNREDDVIPDAEAFARGLIRTGRKIYRTPLPSLYKEPEVAKDLLDGCNWLYREGGKALRKANAPLPPRDDVIQFTDDPVCFQKELDKGIDLTDYPKEHHAQIHALIKTYWDCFTADGLAKPIRGFTFVVDTGELAPIACKLPRYGPHEGKVIMDLVKAMEANGIVEECTGPWASIVVLAAKANQEKVPWYEYVWLLCVSYRQLNQWTVPMPTQSHAVTMPSMTFHAQWRTSSLLILPRAPC
jgi:hypothetical protein